MTKFSEFTLTFSGIPFSVKCWEHDGNECDLEMSAMVESQYLHYPGSSLVEIQVDATVRTSHMVLDLFPMVDAALAAA
jgi:hypothetical protein